jgi:hypothetical protein
VGGELFRQRLAVQRHGEAFDVVVLFPGPQRGLCLAAAREALPAPELLVVDAVTALDLPVLLRPPGA